MCRDVSDRHNARHPAFQATLAIHMLRNGYYNTEAGQKDQQYFGDSLFLSPYF